MEIDLKQAQLRNMLCDPHQREEGFRKLMQMYGEKLYWHIRRIVVGHDDAEDVLQETCIKIISAIDTFRGEGQLTTWIYSIATNIATPSTPTDLPISKHRCIRTYAGKQTRSRDAYRCECNRSYFPESIAYVAHSTAHLLQHALLR